MIANIKELAVKKNKWLNEERFKDGVVLFQSIPGATAIQMATYVGLKAKSLRGALTAYIGFGLPAFIFMLRFSSTFPLSPGEKGRAGGIPTTGGNVTGRCKGIY